MKKGLSLILTCYNESGYLQSSYLRIKRELAMLKIPYELIFVDDGSTDATKKIIKNLSKKDKNIRYLFHEKNMGRGGSVADGIYLSKYEFVGFLDLDLEVSEKYIHLFVKELQKGKDLVVADRKYSINLTSIHRFIISKSYILLKRFLLRLPFQDGGASYKFFRRSEIMPVLKGIKEKGWFWDTEILTKSYYEGLNISEIPVIFKKRTDKKTAVKLVKDSIYFFKHIVNFKNQLKIPYFLFLKLLTLYSGSLNEIIYFILRWPLYPFKQIDKELQKKGYIIDIGCGEGILSNALAIAAPNRKVLGVDLSSSRIKIASDTIGKRINIDFINENVMNFQPDKIDGATVSDFLHHLPKGDQEIVVRTIYKALKNGGKFLIKEIDKEDLIRSSMSRFWDKIFYPKDKIYYRGEREWRELLEKIGFTVSSVHLILWFPGSTRLFICKK